MEPRNRFPFYSLVAAEPGVQVGTTGWEALPVLGLGLGGRFGGVEPGDCVGGLALGGFGAVVIVVAALAGCLGLGVELEVGLRVVFEAEVELVLVVLGEAELVVLVVLVVGLVAVGGVRGVLGLALLGVLRSRDILAFVLARGRRLHLGCGGLHHRWNARGW